MLGEELRGARHARAPAPGGDGRRAPAASAVTDGLARDDEHRVAGAGDELLADAAEEGSLHRAV